MKSNFRQLFRTPVRTTGMLLLLLLSSFLLTLGGNLWLTNRMRMQQYKDQFMTIATVKQEPSSMVQELDWDAEKQDYEVWRKTEYSHIYTPQDLLIDGVEYIVEPEKRSYYASYVPEYTHLSEAMKGESLGTYFVAEFSPMEDCVPNQSVRIMIKRILAGDTRMENSVLWFCDHENPNPGTMYQSETYIAVLSAQTMVHGEQALAESGGVLVNEYHPFLITSSLYTEDGKKVQDELEGVQRWFPVTEGFYETTVGNRFQSIAKSMEMKDETQPVTGTNKTKLLMPFYTGDAVITSGRDISEEEYSKGEKVCLAPKHFMENNQLELGDTIETRFYYSCSLLPAGVLFTADGTGGSTFHSIDEKGNALEVFETNVYTIVGVYEVSVLAASDMDGMAADELVVPSNSIQNKGMNAVLGSVMKDSNTSFQISNGSINQFMLAWEKAGIDDIVLTFYDMGYSNLQSGMANMQNLSFVLFVSGIIMMVSLLFLSAYLYITKQRKQIIIERILGVKKKECFQKMVSSLTVLVLVGCLSGVIAGSLFVDKTLEENAESSYFSMEYSNVSSGLSDDVEIEAQGTSDKISVAVIVLFFAVGAGRVIAGQKMKRLLREPLIHALADTKQDML